MISINDVEKELYTPEEKAQFIKKTALAMLKSQKMNVRFIRNGAIVEISYEEEEKNDFWILTKKDEFIQNFHFLERKGQYALVHMAKENGRYKKVSFIYMGEEALNKAIDILNQSDASNY
ncbi:MAG: hypothetical protein M0P05_02245 [Candidatus Colwellbacteria bacterium]|jgi:hypothetical protein|nr:hypothetical protein [Candidatus Colwellbacteria bacterium]